MVTHTPSDAQRQASYKEALEGRGKKTAPAPHLPDRRNGAPLSKAASTTVMIILAPNSDYLEKWQM